MHPHVAAERDPRGEHLVALAALVVRRRLRRPARAAERGAVLDGHRHPGDGSGLGLPLHALVLGDVAAEGLVRRVRLAAELAGVLPLRTMSSAPGDDDGSGYLLLLRCRRRQPVDGGGCVGAAGAVSRDRDVGVAGLGGHQRPGRRREKLAPCRLAVGLSPEDGYGAGVAAVVADGPVRVAGGQRVAPAKRQELVQAEAAVVAVRRVGIVVVVGVGGLLAGGAGGDELTLL